MLLYFFYFERSHLVLWKFIEVGDNNINIAKNICISNKSDVRPKINGILINTWNSKQKYNMLFFKIIRRTRTPRPSAINDKLA